MRLQNKNIVVTGAGSGIGRELSLQLLNKNANVIGVDIHENSLAETQKIAGVGDERFKAFVLDISDKNQVDTLPIKAIKHFGQVDGIINNAGIIQKFVPVIDLSFEEINRVMNVNLFGTLYCTKAFLPHFLTLTEAHIVNISSMAGFIPIPGQIIYGAAKAAVKIFTEGLFAELKNTNVKVTVVHPGAIATNITENSGLGKQNNDSNSQQSVMTLPASKAATIILNAIEQNKYRVTVGKDARFLDLFYRLSPQRATNFILKKMSNIFPGTSH